MADESRKNSISGRAHHDSSTQSGVVMQPIDLVRVELSFKDHLRNSLRINRGLKRQLSREALPKMDNYNQPNTQVGLGRPSLEQLYLGESIPSSETEAQNAGEAEGFKFGWIQGVLMRCMLNIWGVMLFIRLSWIVAEAGIGQAILIVLVATLITSLTALSMSAISTNGQIKGGGTYYMISRSLGPEFGAAIGIIFAMANIVAVSLHTVGFCESLNDLLASLGVKIVDNGPNDIRIIGSVTLVILGIIVMIGMEWEAKAQLGLMAILVVSLGNFIVGSILGPTDAEEVAKGFIGFNYEVIQSNWYADYRMLKGIQHNFLSVFAIFFPAATGILAGANISGDLKDPSSAIPKGTLLSILITSSSYILFATIAGASVLRDATGNATDYVNGSYLSNIPKLCPLNSMEQSDCKWGLHNSYQVMTLVSAFGPLNYAGCFAATLSSALACFVSAPKVFQALCRDKLFPYLHFFAKGYGKNQEPLRAYALTFMIALGFILVAELNLIAPLISNCYLGSYALVNISTFHVDLIQPLGWRPTFRFFNKWLSLLGCILSVGAMFLGSWPTALITFVIIFALFLVIRHRKPDVNWGSSRQAQAYKTALMTVQQLNKTEDHVKTYAPQILVMTGVPNMRPSLVDFAYLLCKNNSLMVCGDIVTERLDHKERSSQMAKAVRWLRLHKTKSFYSLLDNAGFSDGVGTLLQTTGIGKMKPNTLLLGYYSQWRAGTGLPIEDYYGSIHTALEMHIAVAILRVPEGLDYSGIIADFDDEVRQQYDVKMNGVENAVFSRHDESSLSSLPPYFSEEVNTSNSTTKTNTSSKMGPFSSISRDYSNDDKTQLDKQKKMKKTRVLFKDTTGGDLSAEVLNSIYRFRLKQKKGTIDVWWLYDDGGLSILLPHIITSRSNWADSNLRIFCLADENDEIEAKQNSMRLLMNKFRIPIQDVVVIKDMATPPTAATKDWFDSMTKDLISRDPAPGPTILESELMAQKAKTMYHMRLRELLLQYSTEANLIAMTLPVPRKGTVSGPLYMAWLETLTANMPPFLLVRGNQDSVLTFLS